MTQLAKLLSVGAFVGTTGASCRLLVGERGSGKSVVLEAREKPGCPCRGSARNSPQFRVLCAVASVLETALPSVIPLYVSCDGIERFAGVFAELELEALIARAMVSRGVYPSSPTLEGILPALRSAGRRFLLIVDEIDSAYKVRRGSPAYRNVLSSLGALDSLGNNHSGLISVVLCGSSSVTGQLLCGDLALIADRFPLMADGGTVDLNSQKYPTRRLPRTICIRLEPVKRMIQSMIVVAGGAAVLDEDLLRLARLVAFSAGATPRTVTAFIAEGFVDGVANSSVVVVEPKLTLAAAALHANLMRKLVASNYALRVLLVNPADGSLLIDRVMNEPWETALRPLSWSKVQEAWAEVRASTAVDSPGSLSAAYMYVEPVLWELCDAGLYAFVSETPTSDGGTLWPCVPLQMLLATPDAGPERGWMSRAHKHLSSALGTAGSVLVSKAAEAGLASTLKLAAGVLPVP